MEGSLQVFTNDEFGQVRIVEVDGQPWWVLKDICDVLGLNSPHKVSDRLEADERNLIPVIDGVGRSQNTTVVNESGLYAVILRSDKPNANAFRKWITSEVLPAIRKHGAYMTPETIKEALLNPDTIIAIATQLKEEQQKTQDLTRTIAILAPKAAYTDTILSSKSLMITTAIAKDYGMAAKSFNKLLCEKGIQYKKGSQWFLYSKYQNCGYTGSETFSITRSDGSPDANTLTKWTQKGRMFLYERLKKDGIVPKFQSTIPQRTDILQ